MIYLAILDKKVEGNVAYIYELYASGVTVQRDNEVAN